MVRQDNGASLPIDPRASFLKIEKVKKEEKKET